MRKAFEAAQGFFGGLIFAAAADVAVHTQGVGPIGFPAEEIELVFANEAFGDFGAGVVELVRAVAGFAEQHEAAFAGMAKQAVEVVAVAGERVRKFLNGFESVVGRDHKSCLSKESSRR